MIKKEKRRVCSFTLGDLEFEIHLFLDFCEIKVLCFNLMFGLSVLSLEIVKD